MMLSRPQFDALRYAKGRELYAADINGGDGNQRRTLLWLIDHGMLTWDPIYRGRVVLTSSGEGQLQTARAKQTVKLCPNCESDRHKRCCSRCGKVHGSRRLHQEHCSATCASDASHADRRSAAMEDDLT